MKLELKKVTFSEALSEETNAFTADVYLDGKLVATAKNTGQGGDTDIHAYAKPRAGNAPLQHAEIKANRAIMAQYDEWAAQQPNVLVGKFESAPEGFTRTVQLDVETAFEVWLKEYYDKKDAARLKRLCKKEWVFTLHEKDGKPTDPNALLTIKRDPTHQLAAIGKHLRDKYGDNLKQFFNEIYG